MEENMKELSKTSCGAWQSNKRLSDTLPGASSDLPQSPVLSTVGDCSSSMDNLSGADVTALQVSHFPNKTCDVDVNGSSSGLLNASFESASKSVSKSKSFGKRRKIVLEPSLNTGRLLSDGEARESHDGLNLDLSKSVDSLQENLTDARSDMSHQVENTAVDRPSVLLPGVVRGKRMSRKICNDLKTRYLLPRTLSVTYEQYLRSLGKYTLMSDDSPTFSQATNDHDGNQSIKSLGIFAQETQEGFVELQPSENDSQRSSKVSLKSCRVQLTLDIPDEPPSDLDDPPRDGGSVQSCRVNLNRLSVGSPPSVEQKFDTGEAPPNLSDMDSYSPRSHDSNPPRLDRILSVEVTPIKIDTMRSAPHMVGEWEDLLHRERRRRTSVAAIGNYCASTDERDLNGFSNESAETKTSWQSFRMSPMDVDIQGTTSVNKTPGTGDQFGAENKLKIRIRNGVGRVSTILTTAAEMPEIGSVLNDFSETRNIPNCSNLRVSSVCPDLTKVDIYGGDRKKKHRYVNLPNRDQRVSQNSASSKNDQSNTDKLMDESNSAIESSGVNIFVETTVVDGSRSVVVSALSNRCVAAMCKECSVTLKRLSIHALGSWQRRAALAKDLSKIRRWSFAELAVRANRGIPSVCLVRLNVPCPTAECATSAVDCSAPSTPVNWSAVARSSCTSFPRGVYFLSSCSPVIESSGTSVKLVLNSGSSNTTPAFPKFRIVQPTGGPHPNGLFYSSPANRRIVQRKERRILSAGSEVADVGTNVGKWDAFFEKGEIIDLDDDTPTYCLKDVVLPTTVQVSDTEDVIGISDADEGTSDTASRNNKFTKEVVVDGCEFVRNPKRVKSAKYDSPNRLDVSEVDDSGNVLAWCNRGAVGTQVAEKAEGRALLGVARVLEPLPPTILVRSGIGTTGFWSRLSSRSVSSRRAAAERKQSVQSESTTFWSRHSSRPESSRRASERNETLNSEDTQVVCN